MNSTLASLTIQINSTDAEKAVGVLNQLTAAGLNAQKVNLQLRDSSDQVTAAEQRRKSAMDSARSSMQSLLTTAAQLIGIYGTIQTVREAFGNAATEERVAMGLANITGNASQARDMIRQLNDYAETSQFGVGQLENSARLLANMGFQATEVVPTLRAIGNEIEATGGRAGDLDNVVSSLIRMNDEGQISVFTLRQMEQVGIPAGRILAQALNEDVVQVMKDVKAGTLNAHATLQLLIQGMAEFGNANAHTKDSVYVLWNELKNSLSVTLKDMAAELLHAFDVKVGLQTAIDFVRILDQGLKDMFNVVSGGNPQLSQTAAIINALIAGLRVMAGILAVVVALKFAAMLTAAGVGATQLFIALTILTGISLVSWFGANTDAGKKFVSSLKEAGEYVGLFHSYVSQSVGKLFGPTEPNAAVARRENDATDAEFLERWKAIGQRYSSGNSSNLPAPVMTEPGGGTGNFGSDMWGGIQKFLSSSLDINWDKITRQVQEAIARQQQGQLSPIDPNSAYVMDQQKSEAIQKDIAKLKEEQQLVGSTSAYRKMELDLLKEKEKIGDKTLQNDADAQRMLQEYTQTYQQLVAMQSIATITEGIGNAVGKAFDSFVAGAKNGKQAVRELMQELEKLAVQQFITKPISGGLTDLMNNAAFGGPDALKNGTPGGIMGLLAKLFGGGSWQPGQGINMGLNLNGTDWSGSYTAGSGAGFGSSYYGNYLGGSSGMGDWSGAGAGGGADFAMGGAFQHGVKMFADGDVIGSPTFFGMAGGSLGLMGEAGPEAIMPLTRGSDGKLGIKGGGGGGTVNNQYVTMNVHTNDADSFRRNSRQIRQALSKG